MNEDRAQAMLEGVVCVFLKYKNFLLYFSEKQGIIYIVYKVLVRGGSHETDEAKRLCED